MAGRRKQEALAPRSAGSLDLASMTTEDRQRELFTRADQLAVPAGAEEIRYEPSTTIPLGGAIQGTFRGRRNESVANEETGEIENFPAFLIETAGHGPVWVRGGWSVNQLFGMVTPGTRVTILRDADKKHPTRPSMRIAVYRMFVG